MNKTELVASVASKASVTQKDAEHVINAVIASITDTLKSGEKVVLTGFGTFEVRDRAQRTGKNPRTGEVITIPAQKSPAFKAGKFLKESVR